MLIAAETEKGTYTYRINCALSILVGTVSTVMYLVMTTKEPVKKEMCDIFEDKYSSYTIALIVLTILYLLSMVVNWIVKPDPTTTKPPTYTPTTS